MRVIDSEAPLRFLRTAFHPDDWIAVFLKSYVTGRVSQRVGPLAWLMHPRFQAWLRFKNLQKYNVYCGVNAIAPWKRTRTRDSVGAVRHVFLEADQDGPVVLARIGARSDLPEPSYVLHSSPNRVHIFWRVTGFEVEQVEGLQKQLARELGTDPAATPATQTSRLVGYNNHKYSPAHFVTIVYGHATRVYIPSDFPLVIGMVRSNSVSETPLPWRARTLAGSSPDRRLLDPVERARRYLARVPPAIAGEHGDVHTYRVCCRLVRGFALSDHEALTVLTEWNAGSRPPWTESELEDKLRRARRYGREPIAALFAFVTGHV